MAAEKAQEKVDKGEEQESKVKSDQPAVPKYNFGSLNEISNKAVRGIAKRAFARGHRQGKKPEDVVGMIKSDLEVSSLYSSDYDVFIVAVGEAPLVILPEGSEESKKEVQAKLNTETKTEESVDKKESATKASVSDQIPDIKILNDISDKMVRGLAKKALTSAKREKLDSAGFITKINEALNEAGKSSDEYAEIINKLAE